MLPRLTLPLSKTMLALLVIVFATTGLLTHDPWKSLDAISIEIAHQMATHGHWLVPHLAGEPWMAESPLYHWVAALLAMLLEPLLPFHAAARLASAVFMLAALAGVYSAARAWYRPEAADSADRQARRAPAAAALLLLVGSVGLFLHAHEATPELAAMAAVAGVLAATPHALERPLRAGLGAGLGLGAGVLAIGPVLPVLLFCALVATALACPDWRNARAAYFLGVTVVVAVAIAAAWLVPLMARDAGLAAQWLRESTMSQGGFLDNLRYFLVVLSWSALPAWPLALWALWLRRRRLRTAAIFFPAAASLLLFAAIAAAGPPRRELDIIVMLPALALLATPGALSLRRGAAAALDWYAIMTFSFFSVLVWVGYSALVLGVPRKLAENASKMAPGFVERFDVFSVGGALLFSLAWIMFLRPLPRSATRGVTRWAAGMTLLWGTFATLYMPWADYQKSYRAVSLQLNSRVPPGTACIAGRFLGDTQRAALSYHVGLVTRPYDPTQPDACPLVLVQGSPEHELDHPGARWDKLADVGRPGDRSERYRLYRLVR
jgi:4-amino-4-deoxy-L-arabinose transferase-like glycosyltransferase